MNYITKLQEENKELNNKLASIGSDLQELFMYLHSSKFSNICENVVNVNDVLNRLQDARMTCAGFEVK